MAKDMNSPNQTKGHFLLLLLVVNAIQQSLAFGFDSAYTCSPNKMSRRGRAQMVATIPCDFTHQSYCHLPGASYPWHAVRRFVHENQGLMKRMYGDVRHISILRNEIQNNDIDVEDLEITAARYSRDGFRRTKVMHNQFESTKNNDILKEPHFRPVAPATTHSSSTTTKEDTLEKSTTIDTMSTATEPVTADAQHTSPTTEQQKIQTPITPVIPTEAQKRVTTKLDDVELDADDDRNLESNSVYEQGSLNSASAGNNIKIVESPNLALTNDTTMLTISTTLKISSTLKNEPLSQSKDLHKISHTISQIANMTKVRVDGYSNPFTTNATTTTTNLISTLPNVNTSTTNNNTVQNDYNSPTESSTNITGSKTITTPSTATKPVLRDGQLFQDTVQKDPPPVTNLKGVNACPVKEEVVAPFWANNTRGEILALLNLYPFEQYVHWEKCTHEHKQMYCRDGCRCEQQYRLHRLLAYDPHNECRGIFSDWFRFPSCCICKCYDIPADFRATSRSPRSEADYRHPVEAAEAEVRKAIYEHASEDWYRPREDFDFLD